MNVLAYIPHSVCSAGLTLLWCGPAGPEAQRVSTERDMKQQRLCALICNIKTQTRLLFSSGRLFRLSLHAGARADHQKLLPLIYYYYLLLFLQNTWLDKTTVKCQVITDVQSLSD